MATKVKTAKGRKLSSTRWLHRQLNDPYVSSAKKEGYRSRSAYKLIEIDNKFFLFKKGFNVLDLGCSPGGWSQIAAKKVSVNDNQKSVFSIDIQKMLPLPNVEFIECDVIKDLLVLKKILNYKNFDVVLSDMATQSCGNKKIDHINIISLCEKALNIAIEMLKINGTFVAKILQGEHEKEFINTLKLNFKKVKYFKPKASRSNSSEIYLIATNFYRI